MYMLGIAFAFYASKLHIKWFSIFQHILSTDFVFWVSHLGMKRLDLTMSILFIIFGFSALHLHIKQFYLVQCVFKIKFLYCTSQLKFTFRICIYIDFSNQQHYLKQLYILSIDFAFYASYLNFRHCIFF